jgi:hypothetical protein
LGIAINPDEFYGREYATVHIADILRSSSHLFLARCLTIIPAE